MKFIAFIMAFLVLALSVLPCADGALAMEGGKGKVQITQAVHPPGEGHQDECSPFCICSCCAGFSIFHSWAKPEFSPVFVARTYTALLAAPLYEVALPIWQPPQLG